MAKQCNLYNLEADFKKYLEENNFSRTSINNYLTDIRQFLSWYMFMLQKQGLAIELSHLTKSTFSLYAEYLKKQNIPVKSINRALSSLRMLIRFCLHEGWLDINPLADFNNIKTGLMHAMFFFLKRYGSTLLVFFLGSLFILLLFILPGFFALNFSRLGKYGSTVLDSKETAITDFSLFKEASTSAGLMTIPIIDAKGNLNLSAPYPKIIGYNGALSIQAPHVKIETLKNGSITLNTQNGSVNFIFESNTPPLPYEAAFNFTGKNLTSGSLIHGQVDVPSSQVKLLELVSGIPAEVRFSVDSEGNVHIKGNLVLDGNLIVNPAASIFGTLSSETATSSYSPQP